MIQVLLSQFSGSSWKGQKELWLDPLGNEAITSDTTLQFTQDSITYQWSNEGKEQNGSLHSASGGKVLWQDSWHQAEPVECQPLSNSTAPLAIQYNYPGMEGQPDWSWRIIVCQRPDQSLVVQMTNVAPWGEEARAVRMTLTRC